eukprot:2986689-Lingulodinium_polyedra.AAC.1
MLQTRTNCWSDNLGLLGLLGIGNAREFLALVLVALAHRTHAVSPHAQRRQCGTLRRRLPHRYCRYARHGWCKQTRTHC